MIEIDTLFSKEETVNHIIQNCINLQLSFTYKSCSDYVEIVVSNIYSFQIRFYYGSYVVFIKAVEGELKISDFSALHHILQNI